MNNKGILIIIFIVTLVSYFLELSFNYWIVFSFVFLFYSIINITYRFKYTLPFGELLAIIYLIENVISVLLIFLIQGHKINDIERYYIQVPLDKYIPFALLSSECFLLCYSLVEKPVKIWINYIKNVNLFVARQTMIYVFILSLVISIFRISELNYVVFVISNLGSCALVGLYLSYEGNKGIFFMILCLFLSILSSIASGMFTGFTLLVILIGFVYFTKKSIVNAKINWLFFMILMVIGILFFSFLQNLKADYRQAAWGDENVIKEDNTSAFYSKIDKNIAHIDLTNKDFFMPILQRTNQAWLVSCTMEKVPIKEPFANGKTIVDAIVDAVLPRLINQEKQTSGTSIILKYTNLKLEGGTSMGIGYFGESYVNFGVFGGILFMGLVAALFALLEKKILLLSAKNPLLLTFFPFYLMMFLSSGRNFFWITNNLTMGTLVIYFVMKLFANKNKLLVKSLNLKKMNVV